MKSCDIKKGDKRLLITFREDEYGEWGVLLAGSHHTTSPAGAL